MNTEVSAGSGAIEQSIGWPPKLIPLLLGGAVAGVLYLIVLSTLYPIFSVPEEIATLPDPPPVAAIERLEAAIYARDVKNLGIVFTVGGILCGAALTLASAGLRKPKGLILASVCGGISGGLGAFLANLLVTKTRSIGGGDLILVGITLDHMMQTMLTQFALWGVLGLGLGAGFALGLRGPSQAIKGAIGGMLGGGLFGLLYTPIHATLSIKNSSELLPDTTGERLVWFVLACLCIAVGIALGLGERKPKTSQASAAA